MQQYKLDKDLTLMYVTASSFPGGVLAAHQKLHSLIPFSGKRKYFGISFPDRTGTIIYKAAAEALTEGEAAEKELETWILKAGTYSAITINNYMDDIPEIGKAFEKLLTHPQLDPQGACVEWYLSDKDVQCMVRLKQ